MRGRFEEVWHGPCSIEMVNGNEYEIPGKKILHHVRHCLFSSYLYNGKGTTR